MIEKQYLGDSVYAEFDGYHVILTTENGAGPSNTIAIEPQVFEALRLYIHAAWAPTQTEEEEEV